ncbi:DUF6169 family protein [Spirosoma agri]|uniref:DUF6169 family protein n=1 Tax=Spirosoma agri TaxID=1987381 RepID=UPI0037435127
MDLTLFYPPAYPVEPENSKLTFSTDYGAKYSLYFDSEGYFDDTSYTNQVITAYLIENQVATDKNRPPIDRRIEATVIDTFNFLIEANNDTVIIYYCSQLEGKQAKRYKCFKRWMEKWITFRGDDCELLSNISNKHHSCCLFLKSHPYSNDIRSKFVEYRNSKY